VVHYAHTGLAYDYGSYVTYQATCSCGYRSWSTSVFVQAKGDMDQHLNQVRSGQIRRPSPHQPKEITMSTTTTHIVGGLTVILTERENLGGKGTNVLAELRDEADQTLVMSCRDTMAEAALAIGIEAGIRLARRADARRGIEVAPGIQVLPSMTC